MSDVAATGAGLGEYITDAAPSNGVGDADGPSSEPAPQPAPVMPMDPSAMPAVPLQPAAAPPQNESARAGMTLLGATAAAGIGYALGGGWGALAGLFLAGGARNSFRASAHWASADQTEKSEARKSAVVAMVGIGAAAYFGYRAYTRE